MNTAGSAMRNVLDELKGHLYYRSYISRGSKEKRWEMMAEYLAKKGKGSSEYNVLINGHNNHETLHSNLSSLTKSNRQVSQSDFDMIVTGFLSHLEIVLNSVDLARLIV
jgi:hypothetical protein